MTATITADPQTWDDPAADLVGPDLLPAYTEIASRSGHQIANLVTETPIPLDVLRSWIDAPLDTLAVDALDPEADVYDCMLGADVWAIVVRNALGEVIASL